ncbi:MAG: sterol desaturase family protein [Bacteriovorax sp.]
MDLLNNKFGVAFIVIAILLEFSFSRVKLLKNFNSYELFSNFFLVFIDKIIIAVTNPNDQVPPFLYKIQLNHVSMAKEWRYPLLFILCDFCYYWSHRYNHSTSLGWASHIMHHAPTKYNMSIAYRIGLTRFLSLSWLAFVPIVIIGFNPVEVYFCLGVILLFQFVIHTELIPKLGFLDKIINTPSAHRAHHSSNPKLHNTNYGGITLIFDHLFGTFSSEPEEGIKNYGIPAMMGKHDLLFEIIGYWKMIFQDLKQARSVRSVLKAFIGRPKKLTNA